VTVLRTLIVEDEGVAASAAAAELTESIGCDATVVADPARALTRLEREEYDLVVVDMLYREHSDDFERRRRDRDVTLTDVRLHLSGLAILQAARKADTAAVLWTNAEPNRRLHMAFARTHLHCRAMCPKESLGQLTAAARAALDSREHITPLLRMYLPPRSAPSMDEAFFYSSTKLAIWRAMALGLHDHKKIGNAAGVKADTVKKSVDEMRRNLVAYDPGCSEDGKPTMELARYASQNWQFFLDHTIREMYP
jgi:DNA-binding NarL/FixJ family response regulator